MLLLFAFLKMTQTHTHTHTHTPGNAESTDKNAGEMLKEPQAFKPVESLRLFQLRPPPSRSRDKCPLSAWLWTLESVSLRNGHFMSLLCFGVTCSKTIASVRSYLLTPLSSPFSSPYSSGQIFFCKGQESKYFRLCISSTILAERQPRTVPKWMSLAVVQ